MTALPWPALTLYLATSLVTCGLGVYLARKLPRPAATAFIAATVALLLLNALLLADHPLWITILPFEDAWLYSNPVLPGATFLAALMWKLLPPIKWQRLTLCLIIVTLGLHRSLDPLYGPRPGLSPTRWSGETCRQSTKSTCAPAAAVSALAAVGISTDEHTLAQAAFTTTDGTRNLTLYRALRRAIRGTPIQISACRGAATNLPTPAIVVLAPPGVGAGTTLPIGGRHAIAILRREENGTLIVADPYAGTQKWAPAQLEKLWTGSAFFLQQTNRGD